MITQELINKTRRLVIDEIDKYHAPSLFHLDISYIKGQELSDKLDADKKIVAMGTLLMDFKLGRALSRGKLDEHVELSYDSSRKYLNKLGHLSEEEKAKVLSCVLEHHGLKKSSSLEAEICCNADCYRFLTIKGILGGFINFSALKRPLDEGVKLYKSKVDEKWDALSLEVCKNELRDQYQVLKKMFSLY